ncbi:MAG: hypothetical protein LBN22_05845 [Clostridiales Family XIII bacterium]|jgi:hypothetical protein|nr:hypothetical protein [Clostridiales Family XIII bacterium]
MIKTMIAHTTEMDFVEDALEEILEQLDIENNLLMNSVGIITCNEDYIATGVLRELCRKLPFDCTGQTTIATHVAGIAYDDMSTALQITVLTSDDVKMSIAFSDPIINDCLNQFTGIYEQASVIHESEIKLNIVFGPLLHAIGANSIVDALDQSSGGVPIIGGLAINHNIENHGGKVLYNGQGYTGRLSCILLSGALSPNFYIATIPKNKLLHDSAIVTDSESIYLKGVNNKPVKEYFKEIGLLDDEQYGFVEGIQFSPLLVDYNDGLSPVVRAMFAMTSEGYAVCGAPIPIGSTINIGSIDADGMLAAVGVLLDEIIRIDHNNNMLAFSCIARCYAFGHNSHLEAKLLFNKMNHKKNYCFTYVGGELCAVTSANRRYKYKNRSHNDSFAVVTF